MIRLRTLLSTAAIVPLALATTGAHGQASAPSGGAPTAPNGPAPAPSTTPAQVPVASATDTLGAGEIVVTAQKRNESINKVGLTIQALSGDQLAQAGVKNVA